MIESQKNPDDIAKETFLNVEKYAPPKSVEVLQRAYQFAKQAHKGQLRKSGEAYIIHPARTVNILSKLHVDVDTLVAAYLHDVPEDTKISIEEIEEKFGKPVAYLVDGITKLSKVQYRNQMEQRQIESLKKLFIHSAKDLRVILIKLADRLDNMRSLRFITDPQKRIRIAKETIEIYVPIANLLGIGEIRSEMEDLCFQQLEPETYNKIKREVEENMEERNFVLSEMIHISEKELKKEKVEAEISGRQKTFFSIFNKLKTKENIANIEDILAIRIIVPTRKDCYDMLGIIHKIFKPKIGRVKDYIAVPKSNGYQSIHTTVFGLNGSVVEFQIRTKYMHLEAEYGIAAHYFYKYSDSNELAAIMKQRATWIQKILDIQKDQPNTHEFIENLKVDVFQDRIFVFTPKGDVIDLPRRACALDFAYAIHSDIGNHSAKAEINGIQFTITATLSSGDTVQMITDKHIKPEREWLNFVKTTLATNRIKDQLKREPYVNKIAIGKTILQREFDLIGKDFSSELTQRRINQKHDKLPYKKLDEILVAIAEGSLNPRTILELVYKNYDEKNKRNLDNARNERTKVLLRIIGKSKHLTFVEVIRAINSQQIPLIKFRVKNAWYLKRSLCIITVKVKNLKELSQLFESLELIENVERVSRTFFSRKLKFILFSVFSSLLWLSHPFLIKFAETKFPEEKSDIYTQILIYGSLILIIGLTLYLKKLTNKNFPELSETRLYWFFLYVLTTLALFTVIGEIYTSEIVFNWGFVITLILGIYALLTNSYIRCKRHETISSKR